MGCNRWLLKKIRILTDWKYSRLGNLPECVFITTDPENISIILTKKIKNQYKGELRPMAQYLVRLPLSRSSGFYQIR